MRIALAKNVPSAEARHRWRWTHLLGRKAKVKAREKERASTTMPSLKEKARKAMKEKERRPNDSRERVTTAEKLDTAHQNVGQRKHLHRQLQWRLRARAKEKTKGKERRAQPTP